jgi:multidrug efflux pump subunit AcrA (membrane-fusion protein)
LVLQGEGGAYVWVADQSAGLARKIPVTTGAAATGGLIEVTQGLDAGSRIIARGFEELIDGARIRVVSEEAERVAAGSPGTTAAPQQRLPHAGE